MNSMQKISFLLMFFFWTLLVVGLSVFLLTGCSDEEIKPPTITTNGFSEKETYWDWGRSVYVVRVSTGGYITDDGGLEIISRGVCWNTTGMPTLQDNVLEAGTGIGWFSARLTDWRWDIRYYARAYAKTVAGTAYGQETAFIYTEADWWEQYGVLSNVLNK